MLSRFWRTSKSYHRSSIAWEMKRSNVMQVKSLGMITDWHLFIIGACNYQTHTLGHIHVCKYFTTKTAQTNACDSLLLLNGPKQRHLVTRSSVSSRYVSAPSCYWMPDTSVRCLCNSTFSTRQRLSHSVLLYHDDLLQHKVTTWSLQSTDTPRLFVPIMCTD